MIIDHKLTQFVFLFRWTWSRFILFVFFGCVHRIWHISRTQFWRYETLFFFSLSAPKIGFSGIDFVCAQVGNSLNVTFDNVIINLDEKYNSIYRWHKPHFTAYNTFFCYSHVKNRLKSSERIFYHWNLPIFVNLLIFLHIDNCIFFYKICSVSDSK